MVSLILTDHPLARSHIALWSSGPPSPSSSHDLHHRLWQCWYHTAVQPHQHSLWAGRRGAGQRQQHSSAFRAFTHQSSRRWVLYNMTWFVIVGENFYLYFKSLRLKSISLSLKPDNRTFSPTFLIPPPLLLQPAISDLCNMPSVL